MFKTAVNLVIKRRENDGKVLALNVQMRDMMSTLLMYVDLDRAFALRECEKLTSPEG